jgi:subtilisin family serine protease
MRGSRISKARAIGFALIVAIVLVAPGGIAPAGARPTPANPDSGAPAGTAPANDLASMSSGRWIVQLAEPAAATFRGGAGALQATSPLVTGQPFSATAPATKTYTSHLRAAQNTFERSLKVAVPSAAVDRRYQTVLNGMAVEMSNTDAAKVRALPGVVAVTPDVAYHLDMFSTPAQIGAPTMWDEVGGQANAGSGVKVAVIDGGIYVRYDSNGNYIGNACFDDSAYDAPPAGFPKGDTQFTNKKVIVARKYFRPNDPPAPGDDTAIPGPTDDSHGTHVSGTIACDPNTPAVINGVNVNLSGIAPHAWLMNYKAFYHSTSPQDFQNQNAYVAELVQAMDDAVNDGANVISNSWGASYQNTFAWPDPMVQAAEAATDAGVTMVFANGNAGPDTATANAPANSSKVIAVGAVTKNTTIATGFVDVTGPGTVSPDLTNFDVEPAEFGPAAPTQFGPDEYVPAEKVATNASANGCSLGDDSNPFPPGSLTGKIALISRGTCEFSDKVANAQEAGAVAAFVYNSAAGGDNLQTMGAGARADEVTIPSWFLRRSNGLAMVDFANANPGASAQYRDSAHVASNVGDVLAGFSSRGPTQEKTMKPDVVAPGVDIASSGYAPNVGYPDVYTGFGTNSGTSMATPHVAGSAALVKQLHPDFTPAQIKSALMSTATEQVFLDTTKSQQAGVLDQGAGRIDLTKAGTPGLTFDQPSVSAGELAAGKRVTTVVTATNVSGQDDVWDVTTTSSDPKVTVHSSKAKLAVPAGQAGAIQIGAGSATGTDPGDYQGSVVLVSHKTGMRLHIPVWLRVIPTAKVADVLLVDDDGSGFGAGADYSQFYKDAFDAAGINYQYLDVDQDFFPSFYDLFGYRAVVIFTGDNASFDTSGLFASDQDALSEWLDSGGRLWAIGQNLAEETDSSTFTSPKLGRSRLYHGYLSLEQDRASVFDGDAPRPSGSGRGPFADLTVDVSPGADGAGNQSSVEGTRAMANTDTYSATDTMTPLFVPINGNLPGGAISFGRSSEQSLEETRLEFRYRSVSMGFGLEGVNDTTGFTTRAQLVQRTIKWLLDTLTATLQPATPAPGGGAGNSHLAVQATSSVGAGFRQFRWDFGDGSPPTTTTGPSTNHHYASAATRTVRVEVTDKNGHTIVASRTMPTG